MFDPVSFSLGALLPGITFGVGYVIGRLRRPSAPVDSSKPVCGCEHGLHDHDRENGECFGHTRRDRYNIHGTFTGDEWVPCTCRQYTGPQRLSDVWAPTIIPDEPA
jgi:hypothetical protein